jgi:hypothetical protein
LPLRTTCATVLLALALAPAALGDTKYGDLTFPGNESAQPASWDYWWGAARLVTESGNRYVVGAAYTSFDGYIGSGYQVWPLQGPYKGQSIMTVDGPVEWGHPGEPGTRFVHRMTMNVPGTSPQLRLDTLDSNDGLKLIDRWQRTSPTRTTYQLSLDQDEAKVHPADRRVRLLLDLRADMNDPPLLAGGTGRWYYHVPEDFGYPHKGYQYSQATRQLTGTLALQQPDGSMLRERVVPSRSTLVMSHESDPPEDIPGGLALAAATQAHPRYAQYYNLQWPWELIFADLGNGAQLMFDAQSYHDTPNGPARPLTPNMPTYRVLATLRLPSGVSVPLDGKLHVEHLAYRELDEIASATGTSLQSPVTQAWKFRVSFPGGRVAKPGGGTVQVPPFDLGLVPPFDKTEPQEDDRGNRLTQRVPFNIDGSYAGCPVHGFGWSELLVNWHGWENRDPWFTGGSLPPVPDHCGQSLPPPPSGTPGNLNPPPSWGANPNIDPEGCSAGGPGAPTCAYDAKGAGGLGGTAPEPGGWTVTITRPGRAQPIVIRSHGGYEASVCGTIRAGDHVEAKGSPDGGVFVGNPGICY